MDISEIESYAKAEMGEQDWIHTTGVRKIAAVLSEKEGADLLVVDVACLFHDISRSRAYEDHAEKSAAVCRRFLQKKGHEKGFVERVVLCVESHSYPWTMKGPAPSTVEAQVLFDADMVQQLSAFGIAKHLAQYSGKGFGEMLRKSEAELTKAHELLLTDSGKLLARGRIEYVKDFFRRALSTDTTYK